MAKEQKPGDGPPAEKPENKAPPAKPQEEVGGRKGPEPTRYGDWEKDGIVSDF